MSNWACCLVLDDDHWMQRGGLGLVLHYLSSTMMEMSLQEFFTLVPSTVVWYINFALTILLDTFRHLPEVAITQPTGQKFSQLKSLIVCHHLLLTCAFASINGLNLPVQTSGVKEIENATYNGWLQVHFVSSVLVFSPEGWCPLNLHLDQPTFLNRSHHCSPS